MLPFLALDGVLTSKVPDSTATAQPKASYAFPSLALILLDCLQPLSDLVKRYASPCPLLCATVAPSAPIRARFPANATALPKSSPTPPSLDVRIWVWL